MENYVKADLEIVNVAAIDMITASIEIERDENELPIDRYVSV